MSASLLVAMTEQGRDPVALRLARDNSFSVLQKLKVRLQAVEDEEGYLTICPEQLGCWKGSMDADLGRFNTIHDLLRNLEKDPDRNTAYMDAWDDYHTLVIDQCKRLETLKDISGRIPALDMAIHHMVAQKTKFPLKDFPPGLEAINKDLTGADLGILIGGFFFRECISNNHFISI